MEKKEIVKKGVKYWLVLEVAISVLLLCGFFGVGSASAAEEVIPSEGLKIDLPDRSEITFNDASIESRYGRFWLNITPMIRDRGLGLYEDYSLFPAETTENTISWRGLFSRIEYDLYSCHLKERVYLDRPALVSFTYEVNLIDWITEEEGGLLHIEPASGSRTGTALDRTGNILFSINGADVVIMPRPFAIDARGQFYQLDYLINTDEKTITITGDLTGAEYPIMIDPTEKVTNGGFETGTLTGWTAVGNSVNAVNTASKYTGTYGLSVTASIPSCSYSCPGAGGVRQTVNLTGVLIVEYYYRYVSYSETYGGSWSDLKLYAGSINFGTSAVGAYTYKNLTVSGTGDQSVQMFFNMNGADPDEGGSCVGYFDEVSAMGPDPLPVAAFSGSPLTGTAPLSVTFTDTSTGLPSSWSWDFDNDGDTDSTSQNPIYEYNSPGSYSVNLTASNSGGSDSEIKLDYIIVNEAPTPTPTPSPSPTVTQFLGTGISITSMINFTDLGLLFDGLAGLMPHVMLLIGSIVGIIVVVGIVRFVPGVLDKILTMIADVYGFRRKP